jgi:hypothetical protein
VTAPSTATSEPDWHERRNATEHRTRRLVKQLEALGHTVTLDPAA